MTSGRPFSDHEQAYILEHAPTRISWGQVARELEREFPTDNGGSRDGKSVRNWYRRYRHVEGKRADVSATVPADVAARIRRAGLSADDVGDIITIALMRSPA